MAGCCTISAMPLPLKILWAIAPSVGYCIKLPKYHGFAQGAFPGGSSSCWLLLWRFFAVGRVPVGNSELELASCSLLSLTSSDAVAARAGVAAWPPAGPSARCICCEQKNVTCSLALTHLPSSPSFLPSPFTWKKTQCWRPIWRSLLGGEAHKFPSGSPTFGFPG